MPEHLTVVYTINDPEAFAEERQKLKDNFMPSKGKPWSISAMSLDHEINRIYFIEEAIENNDEDLIPAILSHANIGNVEDYHGVNS